MTEKDLRDTFSIQAFNAGQPATWAAVFCCYYGELYDFAANFTNDHSLAQHIVHESLIKLWMRSERFRNLESIKSFIYITTRNNCLHALRLRQEGIEIDLHKKENSVLHLITEGGKLEKIKAAIEALPEECKRLSASDKLFAALNS